MDTLDNNLSVEGVAINSKISDYLKETAKWTNFLSIIGFVMIGLMVIGAFVIIVVGSSFGGGQATAGGLAYLLMALLYFFPTFYMYNFSKKIKIGLNSSVQSEVELAFENLKKMFKYIGVLMIVILSIYAIALLFFGAIAASI
tara:strand:+ start:1218 stop:1646 length:429 start_codon:yes stop_codon:yes gene_type:complete